jgi:hypothetical protein
VHLDRESGADHALTDAEVSHLILQVGGVDLYLRRFAGVLILIPSSQMNSCKQHHHYHE